MVSGHRGGGPTTSRRSCNHKSYHRQFALLGESSPRKEFGEQLNEVGTAGIARRRHTTGMKASR